MLMMNKLQIYFLVSILYFTFGFENSFSDSCVGNLPGFQSKGGETGR